ncbi:MAG TPA: hypothetical protein VFT86_10145 [Gaiellaceae bacterium]|nr:hypothetical protein [Gaiellaceae bacterium]
MGRALRLGRAFIVVLAGIVAGVSLYVGFVQAGVLPNPFPPVLEGELAGARSDRPGVRVLFVGNSMTYYHGMPQMVERLATGDAGAEPLFAVSYTRPGWTLEEAAADDRLAQLIQSVRWDALVLQEQTGRASESADWLRYQTVPYAQELQRPIEAYGGRTLLYMTWYRRYEDDLGSLLSVPVAPVASALGEAHWRRPDLQLLESDGHHPSLGGSYLAACVFYAVLTGRNPVRSSYNGGLAPADARFLRRVAGDVVGAG